MSFNLIMTPFPQLRKQAQRQEMLDSVPAEAQPGGSWKGESESTWKAFLGGKEQPGQRLKGFWDVVFSWATG